MGWKATAGDGGLEKGVARVTAVPPLFFFFKQIERVTIARRIMVSECKSACFEAGEEESIFRLLKWDE